MEEWKTLMYDKILKMNCPVTWTQEADTAFGNIKQVLVSSTALALPDYSKPFLQMVDCKGNLLTSVLVQQHGDKMKPVAYFSSKLNGVACALPHCVRTPIAASMAVEVSATIVLFHPLTLKK
uniref:Reverse transcriptase/retrotransposon-derived protein RNase H-like domain-containing protein n=1 Tax=Oryzias sinensis TaxID=183150 RepID=A0A8C7Y839_9TELE